MFVVAVGASARTWDRTARVWITDPDELIRLARERVRRVRGFTEDELDRYADLLDR